MMKAKVLAPYANHPPAIQENDSNHDRVEHRLSAKLESLLDPPEAIDSYCLGGYTDEE